MNSTMIALMRVIRDSSRDSGKTYFLLLHAQGVARSNGDNVVIPFLRLAEMNLATAYRVGGFKGLSGVGVIHDAMTYAAQLAIECLNVLNDQE